MPRKRNELTRPQAAKLRALMASGGTVASITAALRAQGIAISPATVGRRMREAKGKPNAGLDPIPSPLLASPELPKGKRAKKRAAEVPPPPLPDKPEDVPEDASAGTYDYWLRTAEEKARKAEGEGAIEDFAKMGRLVVSINEAKRKAAPPPVVDPNENPDMIAAAERCRRELHKMIERAVGRE